MKNMRLVLSAVLALSLALAVPAAAQESSGDAQAVKKAVKENPEYNAGKPAQWFKVLVTDSKSGKDKVRITLPIALVEAFARCSEGHRNLRIDREGLDIDLGQLFAELKKLGPMMFIEVYEDDETVKIWLE
jgi:hypothetical protein